MAANNSWFNVTNEVLRLSLLPVITDTATFDNDSQLQEFQSAAKWYVRLCHKYMTLRLIKHFNTRRIDLPIQQGTAIYTLDTGINGSCIKYRSFFNVTTAGLLNAEIFAMDYDDYNRTYPDPSKVAQGAPQNWILLPLERSQDPQNGGAQAPTTSPIQQVRIHPTPNSSYNLQYRATILPYPLIKGADVILWPAEYEHCLWIWSWGQVERALGEGKEGAIDQLARQAVNEVQLIAGLPDDLRRAVRTMRPMGSGRWPAGRDTGWVASPPG